MIHRHCPDATYFAKPDITPLNQSAVKNHHQEMPLFIEIVKHTPSWVFILFFVLLLAGYLQSRERTVRCHMVSILPGAMTGLSLYGTISAFGFSPLGLGLWLAGVTIAAGLAAGRKTPTGLSYSTETRTFHVPGSWLPLALMMTIFFTKYAVGVVVARQMPIVGNAVFIGSISFCYGVFSGIFMARGIIVWRTAGLNAKEVFSKVEMSKTGLP